MKKKKMGVTVLVFALLTKRDPVQRPYSAAADRPLIKADKEEEYVFFLYQTNNLPSVGMILSIRN